MITKAISKRTKELVPVAEALPRCSYMCPHCGVDVYAVLAVDRPFFRCFEGGVHTHYLCEQLEKGNRAYDPKLIDIDQLFANLFRPVHECEPPTFPPVLPPDDGGEPEEKTETGEPKNGPEDYPDEGPGVTEEPGFVGGPHAGEDDDFPEPMILPCRTLSQLWKSGIYTFGPSERIGSSLRSDIFLWYKDFERFFARHESLGDRVLAVRPQWPINKANAILFASFSNVRGSKEYKKKYFVLMFQERKEYNKACKKLFVRTTETNGTSRIVAKFDMVLVAGNWTELKKEDYAVFVKPDGNNYGVQISPFYSQNQIYPIPQHKKKV